MGTVGLMYVGAVLFINGLMLLGRIDSKSAGIFNLFIGAMQVITPFYLIFSAKGDAWDIYNASGTFLFGLTYLYVGITNLKNLDGSGVGWYSLWVAILAVGYGIMSFVHFHDVKFGIIWFLWAFLWALFFLLLACNKDIAVFTGWTAFILSWLTATIPAFLTLIGKWDTIRSAEAWWIGSFCVLLLCVVYYRTQRRPPYNQAKAVS